MAKLQAMPINVGSEDFAAIKNARFDAIPAELKLRVFGVEYVCLDLADGAQLFVTRHGWPLLDHLWPVRWFEGRPYAQRGQRLPGSTGNVYRIATWNDEGRRADLVVKFSRFAQDAPLHIKSTFPTDVPQEVIDGARFNSPFEEFGLLMDLRRGRFGPQGLRILTKRPLAIFSPQQEYQLWQLGRSQFWFQSHQRALLRDQLETGLPSAVELNIKRNYIMLFGWVDGLNAEDCFDQGLLDETELRNLTYRVTEELRGKGFYVLDNKPKHFILRPRRGRRELLRRNGKLVYLLVDFELLLRTEEYTWYLRQAKKDRASAAGKSKPPAMVATG